MRRLPTLLIVLIASIGIGAEQKEDHSVDGTWVVTAMEMGGTKIPEDALKQEERQVNFDW